MQVKLNRDYSCYPNGYELQNFKEGDVVTGQAAVFALSDKAGEVVRSTVEPAITKPAAPTTRKRQNKKG